MHASNATLEIMIERLNALESITADQLNPEKTLLIISDMIQGFTDFGNLSSPRVGALSDPITELARALDARHIEMVAFADAHSKESPEFEQYPIHCLAGTEEGELITGLKGLKHLHLIHKNSTNGYLEPEFQRLLKMNPEWDQFIVVGNCTDICVMELSLTLKAHFNRMDLKVNVTVPVELVATYDLPTHRGDETHLMALYFMQQSGIDLVKTVTL